MGRKDTKKLKKFTKGDVINRNLVIDMLKYEDNLAKSETGQQFYKNFLNKPHNSLIVEKLLNRMVLDHFGFDTSDESLENYRSIFLTYYQSPNNYDKEVIDSVYYMRDNKCIYCEAPILSVGDKIPNCKLYKINGVDTITLYDTINSEAPYTLIAAFSLS